VHWNGYRDDVGNLAISADETPVALMVKVFASTSVTPYAWDVGGALEEVSVKYNWTVSLLLSRCGLAVVTVIVRVPLWL